MFPKCHSHDSLTSGLFPFLLSFSFTAFGSATVSLLCFSFLNSHKALRGLEQPPRGPLPLTEVGFQFLDCGPGGRVPWSACGGLGGPGREQEGASGLELHLQFLEDLSAMVLN